MRSNRRGAWHFLFGGMFAIILLAALVATGPSKNATYASEKRVAQLLDRLQRLEKKFADIERRLRQTSARVVNLEASSDLGIPVTALYEEMGIAPPNPPFEP